MGWIVLGYPAVVRIVYSRYHAKVEINHDIKALWNAGLSVKMSFGLLRVNIVTIRKDSLES
jgi:hypothetical protein